MKLIDAFFRGIGVVLAFVLTLIAAPFLQIGKGMGIFFEVLRKKVEEERRNV